MGQAMLPPCSLAWGQIMVGVMVVMVTSFKRTFASIQWSQDCCSQCPWPRSRSLLTRASTGDTQTLKGRWLSVVWRSLLLSLGPGAHKVLFAPSEHLWKVWGLILNVIVPLIPSCWSFLFTPGHGVPYFDGIQHSPVDSCSAASWDFGVLTGGDGCMSF